MNEEDELYLEWYKKQTEIVDYDNSIAKIEYSEVYDFYHSKLNRPGALIELNDGERYLIGDINAANGCCSCCSRIDNDAIVVRYKMVI